MAKKIQNNYQHYQNYQNAVARLKPVMAFGYYGGKAKLAGKIADLLDYTDTTTYIEPFGGSAAVLLNKVTHRAEIYGEKSIALCCFWRCMADSDMAVELIGRLYDTSCDKESVVNFIHEINNAEKSGIHIDDLKDDEIMNLAVASYVTVVCSRDNSGTRFATGRFFGGRFSINDAHHRQIGRLVEVADRFRGVKVVHGDAFDILHNEKYNNSEVLFYLDPPYLPATTPGIHYRHNMTQDEHISLLKRIMELKCKIIISGYDTSNLYDDFLVNGKGVEGVQQDFRPWNKYSFPAVTTVARRTSRERTEILWANYD